MQVQYETANANQSVVKRMTPNPADAAAYTVEKDSVTLQFHAPATITAIYSTQKAPVILYVSKGKEGQTVIEYSKEEVSLDRACELILAPLLFDDIT
jgi:hypothetical protein